MLTIWQDDREEIQQRESTCTTQSCIARAEKFRRRCKQAGGYLRMDLGREGKAHVLTSLAEITAVVDYYLYHTRNPFLHIDIESKNLNILPSRRGSNKVATIQLCDDGEHAYIIPLDHHEAFWRKLKPKYRRKARKFILAEITRLFTTLNPAFKRWTAHVAQFEDTQLLSWLGVRPTNRPLWCTRHAAHLVNENRLEEDRGRAFGLKFLVDDFCGFQRYEEADLVVRKSGNLYRLPMSRLARYGAMDVWVPDRLLKVLIAQAAEEGFKGDFYALLDGLMAPTVKLESHLKRSGFRVDLDYNLGLLGRDSPIVGGLIGLKKKLYACPEVKKANAILVQRRKSSKNLNPLFRTPWVFNERKSEHRALLFFVVMDLAPRPLKRNEVEDGKLKEYDPVQAKNGKFPPMDKAFLAQYASTWDGKDEVWKDNIDSDGHPIYMPVTIISQMQGLKTLRGLFVKKIWKEFVRPSNPHPDCVDGHTRSTFNFAGTVTGRGVSYGPNGQQNPRADTPVKKKTKNLYVSEVGWVLVPMDFRANEVRWGSICSGDRKLAKLLIDGEAAMARYRRNPTKKNKMLADIASDIHKQTAAVVFNIKDIYKYDWSTMEAKRRRSATKTVIFGIFYGRGPNAIAQQLGITKDEAKELIAKIRARFPDLFDWLDDCVKQAWENGYVVSPFGRRRRLGHMLQWAGAIEAVKRKHRVWKAEDVAQYIDGLSIGECRRQQAMAAEAGRLAKNSPIQSVASDANNLGCFELITHLEPELTPLSAMAHIHKNHMPDAYYEYQRELEAIHDHGLILPPNAVEGPWERVDRLKCEHEAAQKYLKAMRDQALPWKIHSVVHDSAYLGCHVDDLPQVVEVMEHCFVDRTTEIARKFYGVNMIAPLAVEFEFGLSAGDCETWDWTEEHLERIQKKLRKQVEERDSKARIKPLIYTDHSDRKVAA